MGPELSAKQFSQFQEFIYSTSGIRITETKRVLLTNRLKRRLKALDLEDFDAYYKCITSQAGRDELKGFLDAVTTNETFFFRTEKHFEWFRTDFISEMIQRARHGECPKRLRVWSAACSSGEEAYSLAICLAQNKLRLRDWTLEVVGTDISEQALQLARAGAYRQRSLELLTDTQRRRYFKAEDNSCWNIRPAAREFVQFHTHNLMTPLSLPPFNCIFIRNVLIYFDRESKQAVVDHLVNSLATGGYLVVGPSEGIYDMLGMLTKHSTFLYQKPKDKSASA